jgi:hypothetical protein
MDEEKNLYIVAVDYVVMTFFHMAPVVLFVYLMVR